MAKRKTFYVPAAIFEGGHSAYAVAVYAYLCFCCDKNGVCFPGMETIAAHTGMSRSSVKRTLADLERSGLIHTEATRQQSRSGKMRRGTNRYRLFDLPTGQDRNRSTLNPTPVTTEPTPVFTENLPSCSQGTDPRFTEDREINNNSKIIMGDVPSVGISACGDATGPDAILEPLYLDSFFDQVFAQSVKQAIRTMYRMPSLSVNGVRVGNAAIRERLRLLTIDHVDYVESQLDRFAGDVTAGERYLWACLYNAPVDCMVKNAKSG